jgi:hypothetical protein
MEYNVQGDQALQKKDYQKARSWFSQGLEKCDTYSVRRLFEIWVEQPNIREGMLFPMRRSFNCLKTLAEARDQGSMLLFSEFYKYGIGTEPDSLLADYWRKEYMISMGFSVNSVPDSIPLRVDSFPKMPRKSLFSNRFYSFLTYTYSPTMPFGLTLGFYDKLGFYLSCRTDAVKVNAAFESNNTRVPNIEIENPPYWFEGEQWHSQMLTGALLYPVIKNKLFFSIGGGYGKRVYYREIRTDKVFSTGSKNEWCYNTEASYKGSVVEVGGMFVWKKLLILGGVNSIQFKDLDVYVGLGLSF